MTHHPSPIADFPESFPGGFARCLKGILLVLAILCLLPDVCDALEPEEILVVANDNSPKGIEIARYYMKKRKVPKDHLITVRVPDNETFSHIDYREKVAAPVRTYLEQKNSGDPVRCLVLMYGLPLKIAPPAVSVETEREIHWLEKRKQYLKFELQHIDKKEINNHIETKKELDGVKRRLSELKKEDQRASLDSEIGLVLKKDYPLSGWMPNPFFLGFRDKTLLVDQAHVLMVSRLDGPDVKTVKRMIDDSIRTEEKGLKGVAYFDARWPDPGQKELSAYALYDRSIHLAAGVVKRNSRLSVVLDSAPELFKAGACPDAAFYCGWYSRANYVDAFKWKPGAVGFHIASSECSTLKRENSKVWCKKMLEKGVAATLGPVYEPYVNAFPLPEIFFGCLVDGQLTLAECYLISTPYVSWQLVLLGDPLYRPFKAAGYVTSGNP